RDRRLGRRGGFDLCDGVSLAAGDVLNLTISLIGFIATPCMLLAFSPPVAYRRYLLRRQPETQPAD
ncbi:MAG: hypothetical protein IH884_15585, partial [Myxococcales bacterium]|nr:hypothetical protein [Myxococcales bacterium]